MAAWCVRICTCAVLAVLAAVLLHKKCTSGVPGLRILRPYLSTVDHCDAGSACSPCLSAVAAVDAVDAVLPTATSPSPSKLRNPPQSRDPRRSLPFEVGKSAATLPLQRRTSSPKYEAHTRLPSCVCVCVTAMQFPSWRDVISMLVTTYYAASRTRSRPTEKSFVRKYDSVLRTDHGTIGLVQMS